MSRARRERATVATERCRDTACRVPTILLLLALVTVGRAAPVAAAGFQVLTVGKVARFENRGDPALNGGFVTVGRDPVLRNVSDPRCPATSNVTIEAYLQSTFRDAVLAQVDLDCAKWATVRGGFQYIDPAGTRSPGDRRRHPGVRQLPQPVST